MSGNRALIEAYSSRPKEQEETREEDEHAPTRQAEAEAAVVRALDFLDSCVLPFDESDPESATEPPETAAVTAPSATVEPRHSAWRLPRGLLYWVSVAAAAGVTWRLSGSLLDSAIAALVASAAVILLEIGLRTIDPRIARRLGLAQGRFDVVMFSAAAALGLAAGIAIAYLL